MPRGTKSGYDEYIDFSLVDDRTDMFQLTVRSAIHAPDMHIRLLLHYSSGRFVGILQKREPVDPAWYKSPRTPQRISD